MGFGHRNCVIVDCPNSGKKLNKWASENCKVHGCLHGTETCNCEPPFKLFSFPTELKDSAGRKRWKDNVNREIRRGKLWKPKTSSRICSEHFEFGKPTKESPDPILKLGYKRKPEQATGSKRKLPADRSASPPKKTKRSRTDPGGNTEIVVDACNPQSLDITDTEATDSGNCVSETEEKNNENDVVDDQTTEGTEARNIINVEEDCLSKKDELHVQEQLDEVKLHKNNFKKGKKRKGLSYSHLKTDKVVNLLTGIPTRIAFDALFDMVKGNVRKVRYWSGPAKSTRKGRKFKKSPKKFGPQRVLLQKDEFLLTMSTNEFLLSWVNQC